MNGVTGVADGMKTDPPTTQAANGGKLLRADAIQGKHPQNFFGRFFKAKYDIWVIIDLE